MCDPSKEIKRGLRKTRKESSRFVSSGVEEISEELGLAAPKLPPLPPAPTREEAAISAQEAERERRRGAKGKRRTILTSPTGEEATGLGRKTLLGQ
jgi:hypothetical protein